MHESFNIASSSPNLQHTAQFVLGGEIRFGPYYYSLLVDNSSFGQRIFGTAHLWSPSSNLLAVQEWLTIDYSEGPITALLLIDVQRQREASVARATKRFIVPEAFDGSVVVYRAENAGLGVAERFEVDTAKITEWNLIAEKPPEPHPRIHADGRR